MKESLLTWGNLFGGLYFFGPDPRKWIFEVCKYKLNIIVIPINLEIKVVHTEQCGDTHFFYWERKNMLKDHRNGQAG